ncbi:MAG: M48 family metalloprotease [Pseudomonadota bacterium]
MLRRYAAILVFACASAQAVTQSEVAAGALKLYTKRLQEQGHAIDRDPVFLARVQGIAKGLIARAAIDHPASATWQWEVHTTSDTEENASCMAGGKLLVGQPFVHELLLNDAELAMLLAHEMEHALQLHNLKEFDEALRLDPAWRDKPFAQLETAVDEDRTLMRKLEAIGLEQEREADREGLLLAWRAGWPAGQLANFFRKTMRASSGPNSESRSHASPSSRWKAARELAGTLLR